MQRDVYYYLAYTPRIKHKIDQNSFAVVDLCSRPWYHGAISSYMKKAIRVFSFLHLMHVFPKYHVEVLVRLQLSRYFPPVYSLARTLIRLVLVSLTIVCLFVCWLTSHNHIRPYQGRYGTDKHFLR